MKIPSFPNHQTILAALCGVSLFSLAACKDKSETSDAEQAAIDAAEAVSSGPAAELDPASFNAQRSQAFGFLSRMPASTEGAIGIRNLSDLVGSILESTTYQRVATLAGESGAEIDDQTEQMVQATLAQYAGKELFVIMSAGCSKQFERLSFVYKMISVASMRNAGTTAAGGGQDAMTMMVSELRNGLKDPGSDLSKALDAFQIPPILLGSKISDGVPELIAQLDAVTADLPPFISSAKVDIGGHQFTSFKVHLQDLLNEGVVAELNEFLQDEAASQRVAEVLRKKTIEVAVGAVDNYLLVSLGPDHSHVQFVSRPEESILAAKAFGFSDQFLSKKMLGYTYMSKALLKGGAEGGGVVQMANSFAEGISSAGGSMKKLGGLVQKLAAQAEKLAKREAQTYVGVAFMDSGIRGESIGGYTSGTVDSKARSQFANSAPADAAMVISSVANPEYRDEGIAMIETMFELVDTGMGIYAENSGDDQLVQMKEIFGPDLTKIWGIMKGDLLDGLGSQSGIIVDLKGGMPKIPGAPNVILNEGKIPRIALAMDVQDRAKLVKAWDELVPALNEAFAKIPGQEPGAEFQLPDVMSDDGAGLVTHYFPLPFLANDFVPSLSLNDELFYLSTSKTFVQGLAAAGADGGDIRGTYVMMNFSEFSRFAEGWINLLLQNADQLFPDQDAADQFMQAAGPMQQALELTRGIRKLELNRFQTDEGAMRSSWHLHVEDIGPAVD